MATAASAPAVTDVARERDVYGLSGDVKKDLMDYLDNIASSGDFATMKSMPNLSVDPDVRLLDKGNLQYCKIEVPLGLQDAQKLINAARQAPFGKGEKTIVDTSFRNTWELDPSQFSLSKNWQLYVDSLMRSACDGLGVKTNDVRAELYKMLLYEKGAMFKPRADSEKTSGMFGTLVISLPSAHFGGSVILSHNGKQHEFKTSYHEYLAWYSNVTHEQVTSGCRWVLTYNLVREHMGQPESEVAGMKLHAILTDWKQQRAEAATATVTPVSQTTKTIEISSATSTSTDDLPLSNSDVKQAIYMLEHRYTNANLSIESLKHADRLRAKEIQSICDDYGYTLYLASLEREVMGQADEDDYGGRGFNEYDEDEDEDEDEEDSDGNSSQYSGGSYHRIWDICSDSINLTHVVDAEGQERKPNKSEYEGYTGNEGLSATHWYKDTVIVLVPNDKIADVLMHRRQYTSEVVPAERIAVMLAYLQKRVQNTPEQKSEELKRSVYRACELVAARNNNPGHYAYGGEKPTYTDEMVLEAFKTCMALGLRVPLPALATAFKKELPEFALQSLRRLTTEVGFEEIKPIYDNLVRKQQGVSARFKTLSFLAEGRIVPRLHEILDTPTPEKTAFIMSFLSRIYEHFRSTGSVRNDIPDMYEVLLRAAIPGFALRKPEEHPRYYRYSPEEEIREPALNGHDLALIFQHCRELGLEECINQMIGRILEEIDTMDMKDFPTSILPLLEDLLSDIKKGEVNAERFKRLFQTGLAKYIVTYVSDEPKQLNWSREPTKCNGDYRGYFPGHGATKPKAGTCQDCQQMNVFLQSPTETVWRFPAAEARRKHLINKLSDKHECFTTIETPRTPFSLVVTKHKKSMDEKHRKWKTRIAEVKGHLQSLEGRHRILDNVLHERYADIMSVRVKNLRGEAGQAVEGSNDRSEHTQAGPSQVAGQKRKAAMVDLTDD
ncbi:unnamed protein product [Aureobasidium pullulans]|nr:unnamed protein product [Aureobasidium pullulans]